MMIVFCFLFFCFLSYQNHVNFIDNDKRPGFLMQIILLHEMVESFGNPYTIALDEFFFYYFIKFKSWNLSIKI